MLYRILSSSAYIILKLFFRLEVAGMQNLPKEGGFILASNHVSFLDPIVLGGVSCRKLNFMAKHDLFKNLFFGWLISSVGSFPVKRNTADLSALREAMRRIKNGGGLLMFPEGARQIDTARSDPLPGIGFLASKLSIPVVPVFVKGTDIAWPKGAKTIKRTKISVHFGKQILVERGLPYRLISAKIMEEIRLLSCEQFN